MKPENLSDCEVIIEGDENEILTCDSFLSVLSVLKTSLGKKSCKSGRVWSKPRGRCIRQFFRRD